MADENLGTDVNAIIADMEKLVVDLETKFSGFTDELKKVKDYAASLEAKLLTPENEKKLVDLYNRLKALLGL